MDSEMILRALDEINKKIDSIAGQKYEHMEEMEEMGMGMPEEGESEEPVAKQPGEMSEEEEEEESEEDEMNGGKPGMAIGIEVAKVPSKQDKKGFALKSLMDRFGKKMP